MADVFRRALTTVHWLPAALTAFVIAWLSHQPDTPDIADAVPDWLGHAAEYAFFALTLCFGATRGLRRDLWTARRVAAAVLIASLYGVTDEFHQSFVGRDATIVDWVADTVGATLAGGAFGAFRGGFERLRG